MTKIFSGEIESAKEHNYPLTNKGVLEIAMNKEQRNLVEYLDGIINADYEKSDWHKCMEALTQSLLDNPPEPYSCLCGGELKMFGDEVIGYLKCSECGNICLEWNYFIGWK